MKVAGIKLNKLQTQKVKTWDFASKFIYKQKSIEWGSKDKYKSSMVEFGKWTNEHLINLGPTFVKLGQLLSTRSDLFPLEFINELESLQDEVTPLDYHIIFDIVDNEIGLNEFEDFEHEPFKAASLGQVHRARLKNGQDVVVKVRRPGIKEIIDSDTQNISDILSFLNLIGYQTGPNTERLLNEAKEYILGEINYENEAMNSLKFAKMFEDIPHIVVPKVYMKLLTQKVLIMEFVESIKINNIEQLKSYNTNFQKLTKAIVDSYVVQVRDYGFFHADPHPGNLGVTYNGKLVYYDYGLVIKIPENISNKINDLLIYIIQKNTRELVQTMIDLDLIIPTSDSDDIVIFLEALLTFFENYDQSQLNSTVIQNELNESFVKEKPFLFPPEFLFLGKSLILIDSICSNLTKDFNFVEYVKPIIEAEVMEAIDIKSIATTAIEMPNRVKAISGSVNALEKSRSELKRSIKSTRRDLQVIQVSMLSSLIALEFLHENNDFLFLIFLIVSIINFLKIQKKN